MNLTPFMSFRELCRIRIRAKLLVAVILLLCTLNLVSAATITDYTVTSVTSSELAALPTDHWAHYLSICDASEVTQSWNNVTALSQVFPRMTPSQTRAPFYAYNSTPWYVTNMGFLSPTPYGMCDGFCTHDFFATLRGNYDFTNVSTTGKGISGGDWPMISLYSTLLGNPHRGTSTRPLIVTRDGAALKSGISGTAGGESANASAVLSDTLVEYCNVPLQGLSSSTAAGLTAQVVVHVNGTILMRYRTLPPATALPEYVRSTGLIYSATLRKVVATPTAANGIVAYRFDPVYDACDGAATAAACAERSTTLDTVGSTAGAAGGVADCVWCAATSACASRTFAAEVCPRGEWAVTADAGSSAVPQKFYNLTVDFNGTFEGGLEISDVTTPIASYSSFRISSYFKSILFKQNIDTMICASGLTCGSYPPARLCSPIDGTCPNGNYSRGIFALQSALQWTLGTYIRVRPMPLRFKGQSLCNEKYCVTGALLLLNGTVATTSSTANAFFSVQLYFDWNGVIDIVVQHSLVEMGGPLLAFPSLLVGLVRYGVSDPSTVLVPQSLLRSGVHVRFVPQTACADCGLHGSCDEATRQCGCVAGFYGAGCRACPVCWAGSRCEDGVEGSGACVCADAACKTTCGGAAPERSCVGCSAAGGRCECGTCVCVDGWTGANCEVPPEDACRAYSLDGCAVCGQHAGCAMCHDSVCYNTSLAGTASGYSCSYSTSAVDTRACRTYAEAFTLPSGANDGSSILLGVLIVVTLLAAALATSFVCSMCPPSPERNRAEVYASGSNIGHYDPHRSREVHVGVFTRRIVAPQTIMAVPLKQVSLKRLFQRRKQKVEEV